MNRSESISELAKALSKAQAVIEGASKDKNNPAFRSKYADLGNCWDAARKPLTDNGLSVAQFATSDETGVKVETMLMHASGEWLAEVLHIPLAKKDAHGVGAAITYGRRFGLCAVVGISPEDDDGNKAAGKDTEVPRVVTTAPPRGSARETTTDALAALEPAEREAILRKAQFVQELNAAKGIVDAVQALHDMNLDTEGKLAIWACFDSSLRSSIKREEERLRTRQSEPEAA